MKIYSFFRLLNHKIKQYEKTISNPFEMVKPSVTIIWVEDNLISPEKVTDERS